MSDAPKCTCQACGYEYDPAQGQPAKGFPAGTNFDALPEDWICPDCGAGKDLFDADE